MAEFQPIDYNNVTMFNGFENFDQSLYGSPTQNKPEHLPPSQGSDNVPEMQDFERDESCSNWSSLSSPGSQSGSPSSQNSNSSPSTPQPSLYPSIYQQLSADDVMTTQSLTSTEEPSADSNESKKSSRKRANKILASFLPPCRICGEKASGFHYGANTCEACKGFFRRSLQRGIKYRCLGTGNCAILPGRRSSCAACRFDKCIAMGMSKTAIRTGRYTHAKRAKDIAEVKRLEQEEEMKQAGLLQSTSQEKEFEFESLYKHLADAYASSCVYNSQFLETVPLSEAKYLEKKRIKEELFGPMDPVPFDVYCQIYAATGIDIDGRKELAKRLIPIMESAITRYIQFAKLIPGFKDLPPNDQITLLKTAKYDCWVLAAHRAVNIEKGLYTNTGGCTMDIKDILQLDGEDFVETFFRLSGTIQRMNISDAESAILQAITIMSADRCTLEVPEKVEQCQLTLVDALRHYLIKHSPHEKCRLAKLLQLLTDLRIAESAESHQDKIISGLTEGETQFPPLLMEMWSC